MRIDIRPILLVIGLLLATLGISMMAPAIVDLMADNGDWQVFAASGILTVLIGAGLYGGARGTTTHLGTKQAFIMTVGTWVTLAFFGALPYYWSGIVPTFTDAFFESMSGLTTTGSTVITGLDNAPPGILLWRGIQQWLGGLGIIVMAVAVLPMLQIGGMQLFKIEAFDAAEKIMPRATQISGSITIAFVFFTALCVFAYLAAGMALDDAVIHAMTTVSTGGFSTKDASLGFYDSDMIDAIAVLFMIIGSIPFILYVKAVRDNNASPLWKDSQVRVFLSVLGVLVLIAWSLYPGPADGEADRGFIFALFNVTSIVTGTGYVTVDYGVWGPSSAMFFFIIMFIGGCAGSTSCGIKIFRFQVLYETLKQHIKSIFFPNGVFVMRFNSRVLDDNVATAVMSFLFLYIAVFFVIASLLSLTGLDFITSLSAAGSAISNVGPGLGLQIGPTGTYKELGDMAKWILSAAMLIGRLELFTVLVLFVPRFWRS
ncbi:MAG: TrkH family potassium uptake protein [Rhizobiaceae bacterium]|nr:TrkH family potassium uptake protein [Rhizobiaceae bacterium]